MIGERDGRDRTDTLEAPFVGRDDELRLIKDLFHATRREQRARLVSIIGPAGIGKTRLADEFLHYLDGPIDDVWFHDGRSPAYGDGITFWALGEMVRRRAGLLETDDEPTTRARIAETVAEHVADESERRWIEPALLALVGIDATAIGSDQLFGAWRTFFERMAATAPVVMVFEDFHNADSGLVDFVDHLLEWSRALPIYVVTLARPELLERRPEWSASKRSFTSLFLEPLSPEAMNELLAGLVPGLPDSAARAIVARADGIPLYAVETVRMLLADGKLALDGDVYRPTGDLADLAVPETLTALIASRLDALPPDDRTLVSDAAVLGQSFTLAGLAAVSGRPEEELGPPPAVARPARASDPRNGSSQPGAGPVRLRPGSHPRSRLQHARETRSQGAPSCRRAILRKPRHRRDRRRSRRPLSRGVSEQPGRARGRCCRRAGTDRACGRPPSGQPRSGRSTRPCDSSSRRSQLRRTVPIVPISSSGPARRLPPQANTTRPSDCFGTAIALERGPAATESPRRGRPRPWVANSSPRVTAISPSPCSNPPSVGIRRSRDQSLAVVALGGQLARAYLPQRQEPTLHRGRRHGPRDSRAGRHGRDPRRSPRDQGIGSRQSSDAQSRAMRCSRPLRT